MKIILLSVNPPHAGNLVDGLKTIEWRTKPLPVPCLAFVYETKKNGGCGKVIGEVSFFTNKKCKADEIDIYDLKAGMVDYGFIVDYAAKNDGVVYANECKGAVRFNKPKELSEFKKPCMVEFNSFACRGCDYYQYHLPLFDNIPDLSKSWCSDGTRTITRPPQSWCYVEEVQK